MMTGPMYFHTSIIISRQDMNGPMGLTIRFLNYKNSILKVRKLSGELTKTACTKKIAGLRLTFAPYGPASPLHPSPSEEILYAVLLTISVHIAGCVCVCVRV